MKKSTLKTQWIAEIEKELQANYGIGIGDCISNESLDGCFEDDWTALETVNWIAEKRDLTPINE
jgi:hypothetical protein